MNKFYRFVKDYRILFVVTFIITLMLHFYLIIRGYKDLQFRVYFANMNDYMADFLNLLRYICGKNPYYLVEGGDPERAYLPICYLILYPFTKLTDYSVLDLHACWSTPVAMFSTVIYTLLTVSFLTWSLSQMCDRLKLSKIYIMPIIFSAVLLYTVERGNLIIISAASIIWFLSNYDSEVKWKRYLSCFMLAFSAALKVFPVIFGIMYLRKKMWREIFVSAGIAAVLVVAPFFFFEGGIGRIVQLYENVKISSVAYGNPQRPTERFGLGYLIYQYAINQGKEIEDALALAGIGRKVEVIAGLIAITMALLVNEQVIALVLLSIGLLYIPSNSGYYGGLYLAPFFLVFMADKIGNKWCKPLIWIYFLHLLTPLQYCVQSKIQISNGNISNLMTFSVLIITIVVVAISFIKNIGKGTLE